MGSPMSSLGAIESGNFVEFDVTAAITGDGIYIFAIKNSSTDSGKFSSKEGLTIPELIIETSSISTSNATQ